MKVTGIICEYNPFHLGHRKQLDLIRSTAGPEGGIVCLMSGNYVQRGAPAIIDKSIRAKAAVCCGADLVLEMPVTASLSSAEGFASFGVSILSPFCDELCFGTETGSADSLMTTAEMLLSDSFSVELRKMLDTGLSFPAARQAAVSILGGNTDLLTHANDILAIEYCKAMKQQKSPMKAFPILRKGNYHDILPCAENPSATAVRAMMQEKKNWRHYVPEAAFSCFESAAIHTFAAGERAVLAKLRTMRDDDFQALPYGSEGLWRKLMHNAREKGSVEQILTATKSKRYTRTRLDRMVMCAFLGLTNEDLQKSPAYVRVLALNEKGRAILKKARQNGQFPNAGEVQDHPFQTLEDRCGDLYGLFNISAPEPAGAERQRRVFYLQN